MTKTTCVHSTPPTNTPIDTTRRHFLLTVAAGGGLAAAIPTAVLAAAPAVDPIYAAIERHKQTCVIWDAAVDVRSNFNDLTMTDEQREQRDELDDAVDDAWEPCEQASVDLITTEPTTRTGIITAIRYIQIQMRDDGTYMSQDVEFEYSEGSEGDSRAAMGWIDAFLDTIAAATAALDKAVQSCPGKTPR
jgi:hypothetical protein